MENLTLTKTDWQILESYKNLCVGLADYLGSGFELVLHSLEDLDQSVIEIINGFHTGRKIGSPITDLALNMLQRIETEGEQPYISYFTQNKQGKRLKSSTITIKGENDRIIGLLCINFYLDTPFSTFLSTFMPETTSKSSAAISENFADNTEELIDEIYSSAYTTIMNRPDIPVLNRNKEIISILYDNGIFNLKDSVVKIAERLHISKNTVYMHLRNLKEQ